jgi:putative component of toxin-antitoxin plasmid stabilization module
MNTLEQTDKFSDWLVGLKDNIAKARIISRLKLAEFGITAMLNPSAVASQK